MANLLNLSAKLLTAEQTPQQQFDMATWSMKERLGSVEATNGTNLFIFVLKDFATQIDGANVNPQIIVSFTNEPPPEKEMIRRSLGGNQDHLTKDVLRHACGYVQITSMFDQSLNYKLRLEIFHKTVLAMLSALSCIGIFWETSGRMAEPDFYLYTKSEDFYEPIYPAINLRQFRIEDSDPLELIIDSIGLNIFDLPDIECRFSGLDNNEVMRTVGDIASYIFNEGDVIKDGHTVKGIAESDRWRCIHGASLVDGERLVLKVIPN